MGDNMCENDAMVKRCECLAVIFASGGVGDINSQPSWYACTVMTNSANLHKQPTQVLNQNNTKKNALSHTLANKVMIMNQQCV